MLMVSRLEKQMNERGIFICETHKYWNDYQARGVTDYVADTGFLGFEPVIHKYFTRSSDGQKLLIGEI